MKKLVRSDDDVSSGSRKTHESPRGSLAAAQTHRTHRRFLGAHTCLNWNVLRAKTRSVRSAVMNCSPFGVVTSYGTVGFEGYGFNNIAASVQAQTCHLTSQVSLSYNNRAPT